MLLFIFSLYKTFYLSPNISRDIDTNYQNKIDTSIVIETGNSKIIQDVSKKIEIQQNTNDIKLSNSIEDKYGISDTDVINMFYKTINDR
jgi:hypothetical protein